MYEVPQDGHCEQLPLLQDSGKQRKVKEELQCLRE